MNLETKTKRLYEALFLVDSGEAAADWQGINEHISKILQRNDAEIIDIRKWDERTLAYEIQGRRRGTYILVYFNAEGNRISAIERDTQLSERIMRALILRGDHISQEDINKQASTAAAEEPTQSAREDKGAGAGSNTNAVDSDGNETEAATVLTGEQESPSTDAETPQPDESKQD